MPLTVMPAATAASRASAMERPLLPVPSPEMSMTFRPVRNGARASKSVANAMADPMAVRLMTAFKHSGLLPVAKFIHFATGLMLLSNRAVPFALAADESGTVAKAYGVSKMLWGFSRVTFLVGTDGKIAQVWPNVDPAVNATEVLAAASQLK